MEKLQPTNDEVKRKATFIIRSTPAWLDQHQSWISDGARKLYKTLRTLADHKTGHLLIPGRGWIRLRTVEQKAGMSHNTRVRYMRELKILGGVSQHRDYVTRLIRGRNRKVLGQAQITVLPLHAPNPHKQRASTTDQSGENAKAEPQHSVSTTDQSTTDQSENALLQTNSSAALKVVSQVLSETTNRAAEVPAPTGVSGSGEHSPINSRESGQDSPAQKPPTYPAPFDFDELFLTLPVGIQQLTESFKITAWPKVLHQEPLLSLKKEFIDCISAEAVLTYKAICELWESLVRWIRWQQLPGRQRRLAALAACGIYEPENPNFDPRPIDPRALKECAEEDHCLEYFIYHNGAVMVFEEGCTMFIEGEYEPVWQPG